MQLHREEKEFYAQDTCAAPAALSGQSVVEELCPLTERWVAVWTSGLRRVLTWSQAYLGPDRTKSWIYSQFAFCNGSFVSAVLETWEERERDDTVASYGFQCRVSYNMPSRHCNPWEGRLRVPWRRKGIRMRGRYWLHMSVTHLSSFHELWESFLRHETLEIVLWWDQTSAKTHLYVSVSAHEYS